MIKLHDCSNLLDTPRKPDCSTRVVAKRNSEISARDPSGSRQGGMSLLPSWSAAKLLNNNQVSGAFEERLPSCLECHDVVFHGGKKSIGFGNTFNFLLKI